jgi:hypothetical protein
MLATDRVLLFLKAPRPGTVKTRLAADLGADAACAIYRRLAERQLAILVRGEFAVEIHYAPADPASGAELRAWLGDAPAAYVPQAPGDLGARLDHAVAHAFARGARRVALIGADCPALDAARVAQAFSRLASGMTDAPGDPADSVFGPATDGGYYLLGLAAPQPELFRDIPWSTPDTLRVSLTRATAAGLRVALLAAEEDVDDLASYRRALLARPELATE